MGSTKRKGNKAEATVICILVNMGLPVLLPFGDNEKYDLVFEIGSIFKSIQIKKGVIRNGCIKADMRYKIGTRRVSSERYFYCVDFMAIWCEENDKVYLLDFKLFGNKSYATLRVEEPKNEIKSTIVWAEQYEIEKVLIVP
jgi:hypothetical protein